MIAAPPADSAVDPLWSALGRLGVHPAPAWRWRQLLGTEPEVCRFLKRVALLADLVPCPHASGCGQLHRVEQIAPGDFRAIPMEPDCESAPVSRDELAVFALDVPRLATAVVRAFGIRPDVRPAGDAFGTHRLGIRADGLSPVFLSFPQTPADAAALAHALVTREPFTLLGPREDVITHDVRAVYAAYGASIAALPHHARSGIDDSLVALLSLPCLARLEVAPEGAPKSTSRSTTRRVGNTWPYSRPENASWGDVTMAFQLQEVAIQFGAARGHFDFRQIDGFTDQRGGKRPNRIWTLLRAFALRNGELPLSTKVEDPMRTRTLSELDSLLQRFFSISGPAFSRIREAKCIRCRFSIRASI